MHYLRLEDFLPHLNETFVASYHDKELSFVLLEAKPMGRSPTSREPFGLLFLCATPEPLPQSIYLLSHQSMGEFDIFLVPIARQADGFVYQAIFN